MNPPASREIFRKEALDHYNGGGGPRGPLLRLAPRRSRRVPVVQALSPVECGPACLTSVLNFHGHAAGIAEVRAVLPSSHGVDAQSIIEAGRIFGLVGRGVSLDVEEIDLLGTGTILHWEFNHFVVFERRSREAVFIMDPSTGRRKVSVEDFRRAFTGVALEFEPSGEFQRTTPRQTHFWKYLQTVLRHRGLWLRILGVSALLQAFYLVGPLLTGLLVDTVVPRQDLRLLEILGSAAAFVVVLHFVGEWIRGRLLLQLRTLLDSRMTPSFLDHLVHLPYSYFQQMIPSELAFLLTSTGAIRDLLTSTVLTATIDGVLVVSYFLLLALLSPALAAVSAVFCALNVAVYVLTRNRRRELHAQDLHAQTNTLTRATEIMLGVETIKGLGAETRAVGQWMNHFARGVNVQWAKGSLNATVDAWIGTLRFGAPMGVLCLGASLVLEQGLGLGSMLAVNAMAVGVFAPLHSLIQTAMQLEWVSQHAVRLERVLNTPTEQSGRPPRASINAQGGVRLEGVGLCYGPLLAPSLQDVSLDIAPGSFVALVGRSGSGKSSLASVLAGLVPPTQGKVFYDGIDAQQLDVPSLRRQFGYLPQRPYLMSNTLRHNIAFLDETVGMEQIVLAAQRARVHDDILRMPMGYETLVLGDGATLSGGEKQRVALARALVRQPKILLLDEATSALDALTEQQVMKELEALRVTRVVVTHRLATVVTADQILVLEGGRVVEQGSHAELLARGGLYADMVGRQSLAA